MGASVQDVGLNVLARFIGNSANTLKGCILEDWKKKWPMLNEVEMPKLQWQIMKEAKRSGHAGTGPLYKAGKTHQLTRFHGRA